MNPTSDRILAILKSRDGVPTRVDLLGGASCTLLDIAEGSDDGDDFHHVTTNINPPRGLPIDFFSLREVIRIVDLQTGGILFDHARDTRSDRPVKS